MKTSFHSQSFASAAACVLLSGAWIQSALADYVSSVAADHPLAWYQFNDAPTTNGSTAQDSSGNSHNGTYGNGVTQVSLASTDYSPLGQAAQFTDVSGGGITLPTGFVPTGAQARTIEGWFNTGESGNTQDVLNMGPPTGAGARVTITANTTELSVAAGSGQWGVTTSLAADTWHYFAVVFPTGGTSLANFQIYLDGVLQASHILAGGNVTINTADNHNAIGTDGFNDGGFFAGELAQVAIYNTALSAARIDAHFSEATVPEPASLLLMTAGVCACGIVVLRRRVKR